MSLSLFTALAINTRVLAVYFALMYLIYIIYYYKFIEKIRLKLIFKKAISYIFFSIIFYIIISPSLWNFNFLDNIFHRLFDIQKQADLVIYFKYWGNLIETRSVPWHYIYVMFFLTNPPIVLILLSLSIFLISFNFFFKKNKNLLSLNILILSIFIFPFFLINIFNPKIHSVWRIIFFAYPFMIIFIIVNLQILIKKISNKKKIIFISPLILFYLIFYTSINFKLHPYQNVYFNHFSKYLNIDEDFEIDYYALSNTEAIKYLINLNENKSFNIIEIQRSRVSPALEFNNKLIHKDVNVYGIHGKEINEIEKNILLAKKKIKNLDLNTYIITNFNYPPSKKILLDHNYVEIFNVKRNNLNLVSIFLRSDIFK